MVSRGGSFLLHFRGVKEIQNHIMIILVEELTAFGISTDEEVSFLLVLDTNIKNRPFRQQLYHFMYPCILRNIFLFEVGFFTTK